jgi:type IV secretory pathway VirD2 relaxase
MQRVNVKTYFFKPEKRGGFVNYMQQKGKGRDGAAPDLFTENGKDVRDAPGVEYPKEERFYKIILSPENGDRLDMEQFTKDFMKGLERDEGREFKWAGAVHYDTEHPHAHILIRGVDEDGKEVSFSRDTIRQGMRGQASRLATMELGSRTEMEIARQKEKELQADRFTRLDRDLKERLDKDNTVRPEGLGEKARLSHLADIGLARKNRNGSYSLDEKFERKLKYLQRDGDILKTVYGREAKAEDRDFTVYRKGWTVDGTIVKKGIENEMTEKPYAVVQGGNGKKYYVSDSRLKDFKEGDRVHIGPEKDGEKTKTNISAVPERDKPYDRER